MTENYIIPSDNWEQQRTALLEYMTENYIIPSDNWEQQLMKYIFITHGIISYQAITGNNNTSKSELD